MSLSIVILAAGKGKRMRSSLPKILHKLGGKPLLEHVVGAARLLSPKIHVVYGYGGEQVKQELAYLNVQWIKQTDWLGTGHALFRNTGTDAKQATKAYSSTLIMVGSQTPSYCFSATARIAVTTVIIIVRLPGANPTRFNTCDNHFISFPSV